MENVESIYPLSPIQLEILLRSLQVPDLTEYDEQTYWTMEGDLDIDAFTRAWQQLTDHNPILRTIFFWEGLDDPIQVVRREVEVEIELLDWRDVPSDALDSHMEGLVRRERRQFDLQTAPLFHVVCARTAEREHRCIWTSHHLLTDGWSAGLALQEVFARYDALRRGETPKLDPPPPYQAYISWLQAQPTDRGEAFWRAVLAGVTAPSALPGGNPLDPRAPEARGLARATIAAPRLQRLVDLARRRKLTVNTLFQAAWALLLGRYRGDDEVVIGGITAGRPAELPGSDAMLGVFVGTVPVRVRLCPQAELVPWLRELQAAQAQARRHDHYSLQQIHAWSGMPPGERLFDTLFVFQNFPLREVESARVAGLNVRDLRGVTYDTALGYALMLEVVVREEATLNLGYDGSRWDAVAAGRMLEHFEAILDGMARDPSPRLGELSLLSPSERARVLESWNATDATYPRELCVHDLVAAQAARTPDTPALVFPGGSLRYAELELQANRLAHWLRRRAVGPDRRVGLCMDRGADQMVALLAILRAGGCYVPLDPAYPAARLEFMLSDSGVRLLLTQTHLSGALPPAGGAEVVCVDAVRERFEEEPAHAPRTGVNPENLAYVVYTSGSTGTPKGVAMSHRPLVNLLTWQEGDWRRTGPAVTLQFATISFDASFHEVFSCWAGGGTLVVVPEELRRDPAALLELVEREGVERMFMPAVALQHLAEEAVSRGLVPPRLKEVQTAGEQLRVTEPMRRWLAALGAPLYNHYGPSETHVVTAHALEGAPEAWPLLPSIGRPVANTGCYVLDVWMEPAPVGVPGELFLAGASLARGYLDRPEPTAAKFLPDPFSGEPGARMYRSGDRVRWQADGTLEFFGRTDQQVKVRGFRVEPGEVEAALERHPDVREALVSVREDAPGDRRLVGYVVPEEGRGAPAEGELRGFLAGTLPEHMVPGAFVMLERLPLTPSGKIDRRALPAPDRSRSVAAVGPRTPTEELLCGIWAEVLKVERAGVEESFFGLGGHSLLAMQVISRVRQAFGVEVPMKALFDAPTVAALAGRIEELRSTGNFPAPPIERVSRTGMEGLPLSFAQQRLWLVDQLEPGSAAYNMPVALRLRGQLDTAALRASLDALVRRHETLRTTFAERAGEPVQVVHPPAPARLPVVDLRGLPPRARESQAERLAAGDALRPFDLARGPLLRSTLLRLAGDGHVLLFTLHHVVSDGWSTGVLVREVSALYAAFSRCEELALPELPVQYADYAAWQRRWLIGEVLESQVAYWRERLAGAPPLLELPTDRPRPQVQGKAGASRTLTIPAGTTLGLHRLARSEGATLFMTALAAWQLLLSRYARQQDVSVGTPTAGRTHAAIEGLIGFFINMLVVRTDLSGEPSFAELLQRAREATLGAYDHQELPFEKVIEELQPERSLAHEPFFQVVFALQQEQENRLQLGELQAEQLGREVRTTKFDMETTLVERDGCLEASLIYRTELWDAASVDRMLGHFATLLEAAAAEPERRAAALPMLREVERAELLALAAVRESFPVEDTLHGLFETRARLRPGATAISFWGERTPYAELEERSAQLARWLAARGVEPGVRVGVFCERTPELLVAILGVLRAGGAYVPMDPGYPAERLAFMLGDSGARVLLTQYELRERLPETAVATLVLDTDWDEVERVGAGTPLPQARPEDVAYVIYTSGSTGRPKGVEVEHRQVVRLFRATEGWFGFGEEDVWTLFHSPAFDFSVWEIWGALLYGGRLVVVPFLTSRDPEAFHGLLRRERVTVLSQTPSAFRQLVAADPSSPELTTLKWVVFGGEALDPATLAPWMERYGERRPHLVNMYGITETTVHVTYRPIVRADVEAGGRSPIGVAIPDLSLHVLEPGGEPAPVGVPGELHVGGAGVARGYLNRPELNRERFVADPFSIRAGARLYRSGDLARRLPGGELEYLGRLDAQVKVRGFRIELGEIEAALSRHPAVREAVVVVRVDGPGGTRLVGYAAGEGVGTGELMEHLRAGLPEYMVPSVLVVLESLPLTTNGKIDRERLPEPGAVAVGDREYTAPQTETEAALAQIWAEVLRVERVGREDGFFELGGHSLLATRVVTRARQAFGVEVPLRALFEAPTLAELAARVEGARGAATDARTPPLVPVPRDGAPLPLSFAQQRLWFIDRLEPGSATYNMAFPLRVGGKLDRSALERALSGVVRRHESLRTSFPSRNGEPVQHVKPAGPVRIPMVDLAGLAETRRGAELKRVTSEETSRTFDLADGPLLRTTLVRLAEDDAAVLFTMHHIVSDGWSMGILVREVSALYESHALGEEPTLPELPIQYADYSAWQRAWLSGEVLDAHLAYWRERLAGAPALLELPTDRPRPPVASDAGATLRCEIETETAGALRTLSRREGVTLFMTLLSAWQLLLARYAGSEDLVVGTPIAGRTRLETEGLIGFFVNTLVLRSDLSGDPSFRDLLRRVRETTLGAYQHQELPFEKLVEELGVERSLAHAPLFQVMFTLQNNDPGELRLGGVRLETLQAGNHTARSDLSLDCWEEGERLECLLGYRTELFDEETAERMLRHFAVLLRGAAADPRRAASTLPLVEESERGQVLLEWNATGRGYPRRCIHEMVEEQARRLPGAVAAVCGVERLTYAELDQRADCLAALLARHGIGPGSYVPILMERGLEVLLAMLGVMKSGAAFSPLDVHWPAARVREILDDLGCGVVLVGRGAPWTEAELGRSFLRLDVREPKGAGEPRARVRAGPEDPIYVIYTSGSTGKPKGVVVPHRGITNRFLWMDEYFGRQAAEAVLQTTRHVYDSAVWQLFWPLTGGGRTVLPASDDDLAAGPLAELIREQRVTMTDFVPSVFNVLVPQLMSDEGMRRGLESLRAVVVGGEQITPGTTYAFMERFPAVAVVNLYGPTEASIGCICHRVTGEEGGRIPIGRPISNTQALVLDGQRQLVPVGVAGELYLSGACLAAGYLNDEEKTEAAFVENPFPELGSGLMYRTGDRVRWLASGELAYLGRTDQQVKVRGFRIEPGEIEAALLGHAGVEACAVVAREDAPGEKQLVAYVVGGADADELRARLRQRLPEHMVPGAFVTLDALPLTPGGKLDRKALPAPEHGSTGAVYVAPRTQTEEIVAGIWAEVLRLERVGASDHFFDLGGHSLLATRVVSRVRQAFGVELPLRALFEAPTVAGLAARVEGGRGAGADARTQPLVPVARDGAPLPLSFAQQRLWFIDRLEPGSAAYVMPYALRLRGRLHPGALRASLDGLVCRHETLRTTFAEREGVPVQVVHPPARVPLPTVDLGGLPAGARQRQARGLVRAESMRPFDLTRGPLLRSALLRLGEADHVLCFTLHHIVSDGWSMDVLVEEVSTLYAAFSRGEEPRLPQLPVQYADYAVWQRSRLSGEVLDAQVGYWRDRLGGAPPLLEIPTDRPRTTARSPRGESHGFTLPAAMTQALRSLSRREGTTLFMTLLTGWQVLLARYAGREDIVVGTPIAGRIRTELEAVIGFFVNMLALRGDLGGDPTWSELLARTRETALGAYSHQELPFERLVDELSVERSPMHAPVFQVVFALNRAAGPRERLSLGDVRLEPFGSGHRTAKFDLNLAVEDAETGLVATLLYRTGLYEATTVARMAGHLETLLEAMVADPGRRLSEVLLLRDTERAQLLHVWNGADTGYTGELCIHELVHAQVLRTPDAPALSFEDQRLSYADLFGRACRLAHVLRRGGVGPEVRVGICMEPAPEMIVSVLSVLLAGGAYLPLDPELPDARRAFMLRGAAPALLLTQAALAARLEGCGVPLLRVDVEASRIARESEEPPSSGVEPDNLAYVIYTSGSTGRPKGVMVEHQGVGNTFLELGRVYGAGPGERSLAYAPLHFDASVADIFVALCNGAELVLARREAMLPGQDLVRLLREERITHLKTMPSALAVTPVEELPRLRTIVTGGEVCPAEQVRRWGAGRCFFNGYGATEASIRMTSSRYTAEAGDPPLGRPIANTQLYVLDAQLEPVPVGVDGELYIGGVGVARGYLGRADLTAERFVPDPHRGMAGARLYRTGDVGRRRADGEVEFVGRTDHQVKVRGYRVELGEIEAVLRRHAAVREAVVLLREDVPGEPRLVAYVAGEAKAELSAAGLRAHLRERLPEYMVPSAFVALDALPLTPNGKLDRRALPAPEVSRDHAAFLAPRDALELHLAHTWEALLGVRPVGVRDDFFALGGHSLLALRLVAVVERLTGRQVPLRTLLAGPTVERLARALRGEAALAPAGPLVPIQPAGEEPPLFFVHAAGGNVVSYAALSRHLGPSQPFYGLQSRGIEGEEHPHLRVEDMAADYLAQLRAVQEEGPYRLGGWSMGGLVAFEMARMLEAAGEEVELLALLDSRAPRDAFTSVDPDDPGLLAGFMLHLGFPEERIPPAAEEVAALTPGERLRSAWEAARAADVVTDDLELARFEQLWTVFRANMSAAAAYRPGPCASDLLLVLAEERAGRATTEVGRWEALTAGTVRSVTVPGDHFGLLREPNVGELAAVLADALAPTPELMAGAPRRRS